MQVLSESQRKWQTPVHVQGQIEVGVEEVRLLLAAVRHALEAFLAAERSWAPTSRGSSQPDRSGDTEKRKWAASCRNGQKRVLDEAAETLEGMLAMAQPQSAKVVASVPTRLDIL